MMQCHFATLSSKYDMYCAAMYINTTHKALNSQRKNLYTNKNHMSMDEDII